jgi:hypothetical protein
MPDAATTTSAPRATGVVLDLGSGGWSFVISSQARVTAVTSEVVLRLNGSHWCSP